MKRRMPSRSCGTQKLTNNPSLHPPQFHIRQDLGLLDGKQELHRLHCDIDLARDQQIQSIAIFQPRFPVLQR